MAMLLGAARALARRRQFDGAVHFVFQPAEENEAGGRRMVEEGLFDRFPAEAVFGLHAIPGLPAGHFAVRAGPMMASADYFWIRVIGQGTHAAFPHRGVDPLPAAAAIVLALQTIASRDVDPLDSAIVSVTQIHGGSTLNVLPEAVELCGTMRALRPDVRDLVERRVTEVATGIAAAHGARAEVRTERRYPPTVNHGPQTELAARAAAAVVGADRVLRDLAPSMGAEDFAWMLLARPGAYAWLGAGEDRAMVHSPRYDFPDEILSIGASYWVTLVEQILGRAP
jgi:hippurate hydrolase